MTLRLKQVCVELPTSAVNVALPAFAAARRAAAPCSCVAERAVIERYLLYPPSHRIHALVVGEWHRQTDGRTPYRYVDPAAHTMRTVPVNKLSVCCVVRRRRATVVDSKASSRPVMTSSSSSRCGTRRHSPSVMMVTMTLMLVLMLQASTTSSTGAHLHTPTAAAHCTVVRRHFLLGVCPSVES